MKTGYHSSRGSRADSLDNLAADWLARRERGLSVDEQAEFSQWLLADPRHADAIRELELSWRRLQRPRFTGQADEVLRQVEMKVAARRKRRVRWRLGAAGGAIAAAAALLVAFLPGRVVAPATPAPAYAVRPELRTLPDGSVVELNANSDIAIQFTPERRGVVLLRGEAHFVVMKDPARPFVVSAGPVAVRAVGTAFSVRYDASEVGVLVTEGRVAVERPVTDAGARETEAAPAVTLLTPGRYVAVPLQGPAEASVPRPLSAAEQAAALAWRSLRVEFTEMRLADAIELFNRQNHLQLALGDATLGDLRISGVFWADDAAGFSRLLEASARLRVDVRGDLLTLHRR